MTTVINIHKDSFMFMTGVMSCSWQCHVSLMHTLQIKCYRSVYQFLYLQSFRSI